MNESIVYQVWCWLAVSVVAGLAAALLTIVWSAVSESLRDTWGKRSRP